MVKQRPLCISIDDDADLRLFEERHAQEMMALVDKNRAYLRQWLGWVDATTSIEVMKFFCRPGYLWNAGPRMAGVKRLFL